jgi:hypothetical protein
VRECAMGLVNHPRLFDTAAMNLVTETFHEVWAMVEGRNPILTADEDRLKTVIIQKLLDLVSKGTTDKETLKAQTLRKLPLH